MINFRMSEYSFSRGESKGLGDFVYALGFMYVVHKKTNEKVVLYLEDVVHQKFELLLDMIDWIENHYPCSTFDIANISDIDYNLDVLFDKTLYETPSNVPIIKFYMDYYGIEYPDWNQPWLKDVSEEWYFQRIGGNYNVINNTFRTNYGFNWKDFLYNYNEEYPLVFVGTPEEYRKIKEIDITNKISYREETNNVLDIFAVVTLAEKLYCNQSLCLAIAHSVGKQVYFEMDMWSDRLKYNQNTERFLN